MTERISGISFTFFPTDLITSMLKYWTHSFRQFQVFRFGHGIRFWLIGLTCPLTWNFRCLEDSLGNWNFCYFGHFVIYLKFLKMFSPFVSTISICGFPSLFGNYKLRKHFIYLSLSYTFCFLVRTRVSVSVPVSVFWTTPNSIFMLDIKWFWPYLVRILII